MTEPSNNNDYNELEALRAAKRQQDIKLELLKARYEEDISSFNQLRVEQIFRNSGAREYIERIKDGTKIKDDIIFRLKEDLEFKDKEIAELEDRCRKIESAKNEYLRHWKDAQTAREKLEAELKSGHSVEDQRLSTKRHHNMSSASSIVDNQVPPPPAIDVPTIDEILRSVPSPQGKDLYDSLDSSIPPPPPLDVPIDLIKGNDDRAFKQEQGEFLCHVYITVSSDVNMQVLGDIIELVEAEESRSPSSAFCGWTVISNNDEERSDSSNEQFHITLIRGHRVIYHHQIESLLNCIKSEIINFRAFKLCLDKLKLLYNHEKTKQFLCLATRETNQAKEILDLAEMKQKLRTTLNQFATRKTEEDESHDTLAHCSLMRRYVQQVQDSSEVDDLSEIEKLCNDNLTEYPICIVQVDTIHIKIGNRVYRFNLRV